MPNGHCLCGAVRFTYEGAPTWVLHCHCESCRRATASAMTTFVCVPDAALTWTGTATTFASSANVTRGFCRTCGSPLFYRNLEKPDETHLYAALLDNPDDVTPEGHDFVEDRIGWMHPLPAVTPKEPQ